MLVPALALALSITAPLSRADLDSAAQRFARMHPRARLVHAQSGGLEHASGLLASRMAVGDEANARAFLSAQGRAFGVMSSADLRTLRVWSSPETGGTALFERSVNGLPIFGGTVAVGWRSDGAITLVNGARVLAAEPRGEFHASGDTAVAAAIAATPGTASGARLRRGWLQYEGVLQPVFRIEHDSVDPLDSFVTYVDGDTGQQLYRFSRTRSLSLPACSPCASPPCVCTYADSPITPPPSDGATANTPGAFPARDLLPPGDRLEGKRTAAFDCTGRDAKPSECVDQFATAADGSFMFAPDPSMRRVDDAFAEQSAYFHIDDHSRFLDSLDDACLATPRPDGAAPRCFAERTVAGGVGYIPGYVNVLSKGAPVDNAYFTPSGGPEGSTGVMIFGQGTFVDLAYDAEIVYHELTHAAVEVTAGFEEFTDRFGANSDPGALNEGTADTFAVAHAAASLAPFGPIDSASCMSSYFGADIGSACLRQAANVRTCRGNGPNDGRDPGRDGEVHDDGEIWTGFTWALLDAASAHGLLLPVASAMFKALESVGQHPSFDGYAATVRQKMADAGLSQEALDFADCTIAQRDMAGCADRAVALFSGERAQGGFFGVASAGSGITTAGQQYFVDVPCGATALHIHTGDMTGRGELLIRHGQPVEFSGPGLSRPQYDWDVPSNEPDVIVDAQGCAACACSGTRTPLGAGRWYLLPTGNANDAGGNTNLFELGVSIDTPAGQPVPEREPYVIGESGSTGTNVCTWGVTGPVPSNPTPRAALSAPPLTGCAGPAAPPAAPVCTTATAVTAAVGRFGCSSTAGTPGFLALLLLASLAVRRRPGSRA